MKSFSEIDETELDFNDSDQDKVISQIIFDGEFLGKCVRQDLAPDLFTGEIRQQIVDYTYQYYKLYQEAPTDDIMDILDSGGNIKVKIKDDDMEVVTEFIIRVIRIKNTPGKVKQLYDKVALFKKKQVLYKALTKLNKMKDRIDGSPDKMAEEISKAHADLSKTEVYAQTESIFDAEGYEEGQWITRFGIPEIDNACGGGLIAPNLVIIQAFTGRGKTWSITHLAKMAARLGNDCVILETEMANKKFKARMRMTLTGKTGQEMRADMNDVDRSMRASLVNGAQIHLVSEDVKMGMDSNVDMLDGIVKEIEDRTGREQKLIFIDSPDDLEPPKNIQTFSGIDKSKAIFTWLRNYSQDQEKCIIVTCQSQRSAENLTWTTSGNIGDDINKVRRATLGISINGSKKEVEAGYTRLLVFKNTHGPEMKACWLFNNFERGQWGQDNGPIKRMEMDPYKTMLAQRGVYLNKKTPKAIS